MQMFLTDRRKTVDKLVASALPRLVSGMCTYELNLVIASKMLPAPCNASVLPQCIQLFSHAALRHVVTEAS